MEEVAPVQEIEITPEMIEAGAREMECLIGARLETETCSTEWICQKVLEACLSASKASSANTSSTDSPSTTAISPAACAIFSMSPIPFGDGKIWCSEGYGRNLVIYQN